MQNKLKKYISEKGVIAMNGPFGVGKTTFLKKYMESNEGTFITFNAWEFDFSENPKAAFLLGVYKSLYDRLPDERKLDELWKKGWKNIWALIKNGLKHKGVSNQGALTKEENDFKTYMSTNILIENIKECIKDICDKYENDVVLIIDDLDRARPDFSLEIFEIAKHIFDVESLSVLLVYNKDTMEEIIKLKFGLIKGEGYLDKYIDRRIDFEEEDIQKVFLNPIGSFGTTIFSTVVHQLSFFFPISRRKIEDVIEKNHCTPVVHSVENVSFTGIEPITSIFWTITIFFNWFLGDDPFERKITDNNKTIKIKEKYRPMIKEVIENSWLWKQANSPKWNNFKKIVKLINSDTFILHELIPEENRIQRILADYTI